MVDYRGAQAPGLWSQLGCLGSWGETHSADLTTNSATKQ